jgi:hypothetical protein
MAYRPERKKARTLNGAGAAFIRMNLFELIGIGDGRYVLLRKVDRASTPPVSLFKFVI